MAATGSLVDHPAHLYKYLSPNGPQALGLITNGLVRFTQPSALNDVFEVEPVLGALATPEQENKEVARILPRIYPAKVRWWRRKIARMTGRRLGFREFVRESGVSKRRAVAAALQSVEEKRPKFASDFHEAIEKHLGVFCLTASPDNLLMWAHYGARHAGLLVEFDASHPFFNQERGSETGQLGQILPVQYPPEPPRQIYLQMKLNLFFSKSCDWSYEKEWRMILPLSEAERRLPGRSPEVCLFRIDPACITRVIFGCRMDALDRDTFTEAIKQNPGLQHVTTTQAVRVEERWAVRIPGEAR